MPKTKINFTKAKLLAIKPPIKPEGKNGGVFETYKDEKEQGLALLVSNGGAKTFYLIKKISGRVERIRLGAFPDMTIEQARKAAINEKSEIVKGKNPNEQKRKMNQEITFGQLFEEYMQRYSKKNKRSWKYDEREVNRFLSHWFKRKVSKIDKQEVKRLFEKIGEENGLFQANRILERIKAIYNKGIEWGLEIENPAKGIKKNPEKSRERFIQSDELPYFWKALAFEENETARDYIVISLLTGARRSNVLSMRWEEINFERCEWHIPLTKNGEEFNALLPQQAVEILQERRRMTNSEWVFPSSASASGHLADPKKSWDRIRKHASMMIWQNDERLKPVFDEMHDDWQSQTINMRFKAVQQKAEQLGVSLPVAMLEVRLHDLRRTLGSWQAITGSTSAIIGKSLGHKSIEATKIYERLSNDPVRKSVERAAKAMLGEEV